MDIGNWSFFQCECDPKHVREPFSVAHVHSVQHASGALSVLREIANKRSCIMTHLANADLTTSDIALHSKP
jgi:hypothetical protein